MDELFAFLTREHDRRAVRSALPAEVAVHFATQPTELLWPRLEGASAAVLVELQGSDGSSLEHTLEALHRLAPTIPVCLYIPLKHDVVREVVRLVARGLVTDVMSEREDFRAALELLLRHSRKPSETEALWSVWHDRMAPDAQDIVTACIDASERATTVADVAHNLNRSTRVLARQLRRAGLPSVHRVVSWCRLLRAMYRMDQPGANVKTIAAELDYPSTHQMLQHLRRCTDLTVTGLRAGNRFKELTAWVQAELLGMRVHAEHREKGARATKRVGKRSQLADSETGQRKRRAQHHDDAS